MLLYTLKIKDREYKILEENDFMCKTLVERNIKNDELVEFYEDCDKFYQDNCYCLVEETSPYLYLIETNQSGWDTYDSAVFCAYTPEQAIELSQERMNSFAEYRNTAEKIGKAYPNIEIGEVVSSFNAG